MQVNGGEERKGKSNTVILLTKSANVIRETVYNEDVVKTERCREGTGL